MNKKASGKSTVPGVHIFLDITSPTTQSVGGKHHWLMTLDNCTDLSRSYFLKKKSEMAERIVRLIKDLKSKHGIVVKCGPATTRAKILHCSTLASRKDWA